MAVWIVAVGLMESIGGDVQGQGATNFPAEVDRLIEGSLGAEPAPPATDGEYLRRVWLDFSGMIPTSREAREFLDDPSPYKRQRLVEELSQRPEFSRRMQVVFDLWLMERRPDQHVSREQWTNYLRDFFSSGKPYTELVREILSADGADPAHRVKAKFYLDRGGEPHQITRDVGRVFLGRDLQCAQCHDHVLVDDYKQAHYHGLLAYFSRSYLVDRGPGKSSLAEKAEGDVTYRSVFKKKVEHKTGPRILDRPESPEAALPGGQAYIVAPGDGVHAIPSVSRRALLADELLSPDVVEFDRNLANRLWFLLMGYGLVEPLDMHHSENPPTHPDLLDLLARELRERRHDLRSFLVSLAQTRVYARSSEPAPDSSEDERDPKRYGVRALRPLSPEQLAWSTMQALGVVEAARASQYHRSLDQDPRFRDLVHLDQSRKRLGEKLIEERVHDELAPSAAGFIRYFSRPPGQAQDGAESTVHQALFLSNGGEVQNWLAASKPLLVGRLAEMEDPRGLAEELYLAVLSRRPTREEAEEVDTMIQERSSERVRVIQDLVWALLTSTEFRFSH